MHVLLLLIDLSRPPWRAFDCSKNISLGHSLWLCLNYKKWTPCWFVHNGSVVIEALDKLPEFCHFCRGRLWRNLAHCPKWRALCIHGFSKSLGCEKCTWDTEHIFSCFIFSTSESPPTPSSPRVIFSLSQHPWLIRIIANIYWVLICARQWLGICVLLISFLALTLEDKFLYPFNRWANRVRE